MSRFRASPALRQLFGGEGGTKLEPFPVYLRKNFRNAFWRAAIFWWAVWGVLTIGLVIALVVIGEYRAAFFFLGIGVLGGALNGAMLGALFAPVNLLGRWMRDREEELRDLQDRELDAIE